MWLARVTACARTVELTSCIPDKVRYIIAAQSTSTRSNDESGGELAVRFCSSSLNAASYHPTPFPFGLEDILARKEEAGLTIAETVAHWMISSAALARVTAADTLLGGLRRQLGRRALEQSDAAEASTRGQRRKRFVDEPLHERPAAAPQRREPDRRHRLAKSTAGWFG